MVKPLVIENVSKTFDNNAAVRDISFAVEAGEVLGIIGPNGAGKTTTIKMILGLLHPDTGSIRVFGQSITDRRARQKLGYMPEAPYFYPHLTGLEILSLAGELFGMSREQIKDRSLRLLNKVGLNDAGHRQLQAYSKGMLQRVCLAQALINEPELLFLDEPLDGLDPLGRISMKEILLEVRQAGTAIVFNSHILSDVEILSDRIAIMDKGRILRLGTASQLIPKGQTLEKVFIETIEATTHAS